MPKGRGGGPKKSHKGKSRHFTDPREIEQQEEKEAKAKEWRKKKGLESDEEDGEEVINKRGAVGELPPSGSESEEESSEEEEARPKGVEHLIEIHNPNRSGGKSSRKVTEMDSTATTQLTRREREEVEKQEATRRYQQLHAEGKTEEARADLARLALIRKQREEAAKKKEQERIAREEKSKKKS